MNFTCNAGFIDSGHWVHDPHLGGGRIIGEACHFVDLLQFISGSPIVRAYARAAQNASSAPLPDCMAACLEFADGSVGQINYFANGTKKYPKETLEVFSQQRVFRLENFRRVRAFGTLPVPNMGRQDKGHEACITAFVESIRNGGPSPIPFDQIVNTTSATIALVQCLTDGFAVEIGKGSAADALTKPT
jgi:predicted dehydrogenase